MNVFWSDIESRFLRLHSEQRSANGLVHAINDDDTWALGGPEDLQKKFRSIVRNIAVRLGWAGDRDPLSEWCELLKRHGLGYHEMPGSINRRKSELDTEQMCSIEREQRDTQGGTIDLLCKMSAEYCIECDTKEAAAATATVRLDQREAHWTAEAFKFIRNTESVGNRVADSPEKTEARASKSKTRTGVPFPAAVRSAASAQSKPHRSESQRRARVVKKILWELRIIKPKMHNDGHFEQVRRKYPAYLTFKLAKRDDDVRQWVSSIADRRDLVKLAQEIATRNFPGITLSTIKTDWSHRRQPR